jgi:hypothetical protein
VLHSPRGSRLDKLVGLLVHAWDRQLVNTLLNCYYVVLFDVEEFPVRFFQKFRLRICRNGDLTGRNCGNELRISILADCRALARLLHGLARVMLEQLHGSQSLLLTGEVVDQLLGLQDLDGPFWSDSASHHILVDLVDLLVTSNSCDCERGSQLIKLEVS